MTYAAWHWNSMCRDIPNGMEEREAIVVANSVTQTGPTVVNISTVLSIVTCLWASGCHPLKTSMGIGSEVEVWAYSSTIPLYNMRAAGFLRDRGRIGPARKNGLFVKWFNKGNNSRSGVHPRSAEQTYKIALYHATRPLRISNAAWKGTRATARPRREGRHSVETEYFRCSHHAKFNHISRGYARRNWQGCLHNGLLDANFPR